jgi:hypothetical protein
MADALWVTPPEKKSRPEEAKVLSSLGYTDFTVSTCGLLFDTLHQMSDHTEVRIQQLCTQVLAAKTQSDVARIIPELRAALQEHIRLAKESLELQARSIVLLKGEAHKDSPTL